MPALDLQRGGKPGCTDAAASERRAPSTETDALGPRRPPSRVVSRNPSPTNGRRCVILGARHLSAICFTYLDAKMTIELHSSKDESEGGETLREKFLKKIAGDLHFQQAEKSGQAFVLGTCTLKIARS